MTYSQNSQNSPENTCATVSFLIKLPTTLLKKRLRHRCFPVNFEKFLRTPFSQNNSGRLLLYNNIIPTLLQYADYFNVSEKSVYLGVFLVLAINPEENRRFL